MAKDKKEILREKRAKKRGRGETNKGKKKREKEKIFERSNNENWVEAGRGRSCNRSIVG